MNDSEKGSATVQERSAARLAAVQALYQLGMDADTTVDRTILEFERHRLGREVDGDVYANADGKFFEDLVRGATERKEELDALLEPAITKNWSLERVERILKCILRAAIYELVARPDVPSKVVINEYLEVTHSFYGGSEPGFVNGILDRLARDIRNS